MQHAFSHPKIVAFTRKIYPAGVAYAARIAQRG